MRENIMVYKRFGTEEYIMQTTVNPSGKTAVVKWYIRSKPYMGSAKFTVVHEGESSEIPLVKSRNPERAFENKKQHYINQMNKHIQSREDYAKLIPTSIDGSLLEGKLKPKYAQEDAYSKLRWHSDYEKEQRLEKLRKPEDEEKALSNAKKPDLTEKVSKFNKEVDKTITVSDVED